jgi:electron transport complex protein RnfG
MASVKRAGPFRLIATLGVAGFFSGLVLVTVFLATQPLILRNQAEALEAAIYRVLPGSSSRKAFVLEGESLIPAEGANVGPGQEAVFGAYDDQGELIGYGIPSSGPGFQDTIKLIYGYYPKSANIIGMEVLESRETPGLGDKIIKDQNFLDNFKALSIKPEVVAVKPGTREESNEVDTISGATISSKAVVKIINEGNRRWINLVSQISKSEEQP